MCLVLLASTERPGVQAAPRLLLGQTQQRRGARRTAHRHRPHVPVRTYAPGLVPHVKTQLPIRGWGELISADVHPWSGRRKKAPPSSNPLVVNAGRSTPDEGGETVFPQGEPKTNGSGWSECARQVRPAASGVAPVCALFATIAEPAVAALRWTCTLAHAAVMPVGDSQAPLLAEGRGCCAVAVSAACRP